MAWTAKVVAPDGTVHGTLSDAARISGLVEELNAPGGVTISLPTTHADASLMQVGREIQILDGSTIVFWGPIVRPQAGLDETTWQCQGLLWYFQHRFFGRADRVNLLTNGDFESGETGWSYANGVTHSVETSTPILEGTKSQELSGATADHVQYAHRTYTSPPHYHPLGDAVTVSAWVYVDSATYLGGALDDMGLVAIHRNSAGATLGDAQIATIGDTTPRDEWIQLEVVVGGVKLDDTIEVQLYPPHGTAWYDLVTLTLMESLYFGWNDVADIINGIVLYAQDNGTFTHGKSDLNIAVDVDLTSVMKTRNYFFSEHRGIADAIDEFVREGVVDIGWEFTSTTRTLKLYSPAKGVLYGTTLNLTTNIADFTYSFDGDRAASSVVVLGPGDGPDRPEGGAVDAGGFAGSGTTLEIVESAPEDVTIGELDDWAADTLNIALNPEILEVTTLPGTTFPHDLRVGDTVPVVISYGWLNINATYRAVRVEVDPYMDQATIAFNPLP